MPSSGRFQNRVVHGLAPQFHRADTAPPQTLQRLRRNGVGPGRNPDRRNGSRLKKWPNGVQQFLLLFRGNGRKAAAVKGRLRSLPGQGQGFGQQPRHIRRHYRAAAAGNGSLVTEDALMGAAPVGYKNGENTIARHGSSKKGAELSLRPWSIHSLGYSFSMACSAAACSARFLLEPLPMPTTSPLRVTSTRKVLSWSGPDSVSSV